MSGPFGSTAWMANPSTGGFYDFPITNSLRFEDGDTAYLTKTPSSASNQKTWTWSGWVKRGNITTDQVYFGARALSTSTPYFFFGFNTSTDILAQNSNNAGALYTTQKFRDTSAWYHIVYAVDTTQGTASNRVKVYVNGSQITDFGTENDPSQNVDTAINSTIAHWTGIITNGAGSRTNPIDGYMADVNFIDGAALTPSSFGETKNDIWIPKDTSGLTFGTNGYRLEFKQVGTGTASSTTIGADTSGNDNHWTSTNLVASDVVPDSPTNNFATLNPLSKDGHTLSQGNLHVSGNVVEGHLGNTFFVETGKWYYEGNLSTQQNDTAIGLVNSSASVPDNWTGETANTVGYLSDGRFFENGSSTSYSSYGTSDIAQFAFDADTGEIWIGKNNTWQNSGDPAGGTGEVTTVSWDDFSPAARTVASGAMCFNFGQDSSFAGTKTAQGNADANDIGDFYYAPPSGFLALCTSNLPAPVAAIDPAQGGSPQDYFNTVLYTGNAGTQSISVGFQPDFTWNKQRSGTDYHALQNSVAGPTKILVSNTTEAERTITDCLTAFTSTGFTLGADSSGYGNENTQTYASWNWKAGTAFSNDASSTSVGTVDSSGSVSADTGFSIVSWTGLASGSNYTISHGLSSPPAMIIIKTREEANDWMVYHHKNTSAPETEYVSLQTTAATSDYPIWADTAPTSSVFTLGTWSGFDDGTAMIGYCFVEVDGYSKFGSYAGNSNADGTFVYTGFRPAFILWKKTTGVDNWGIHDNKRGPNNVVRSYLKPDQSDAEAADDSCDFLSNGFKWRLNSGLRNENGQTYIFMAFAEQPFKYANAR